ncbi:hypothetical protein ACFE04_028407 [Oxalis oulophora]
MFTNDGRQEERTGKYGTSRLQYLQELVSKFQNSTTEEEKEKFVANLANFAYDPYNYTFLRQLNVLELFLDCLTEPNEKLVEFGIGGICNASVDPANAAVITDCEGIPLVVHCLSSPVKNTVNYALGALYYLCDEFNKEEILKPEVVDLIKRYASAETLRVFSQVFVVLKGHNTKGSSSITIKKDDLDRYRALSAILPWDAEESILDHYRFLDVLRCLLKSTFASTPLWRNGPPDKPVLCNACGSRWRTKGTLVNYTPLHSRPEDGYDDHRIHHRISKVKSISVNKNKEMKHLKQKPIYDNVFVGATSYNNNNQGFRKIVDEDTSNRSSSGSAISNTESCAQFGGSQDASDLTGPSQSNVLDTMVPSKKRTCGSQSKSNPSPLEKLTKDLCTILHEQQSYFSGSSEEDLLFESETPMVSVEIGHGSVLFRHPSSIARDEESEASSLSVENKQYSINEAYSHMLTLPARNKINHSSPVTEKAKNFGQEMQQEQLKREESQHEKLQVLGSYSSPLCNIDLGDIVNYEEFARSLTNEEQQHLLKYLPPLDVAKLPDNLKSMFNSLQFKENLSSFQQLLGEGLFDLSSPGAKTEDYKTLRRLALTNLTKSKWVEHHNLLKKCKSSIGGSVPTRASNTIVSTRKINVKRPRDNLNQNFPEAKSTMKIPRRVILKPNCEGKETTHIDGSCFSPTSLFALPGDGNSLMLDSLRFVGESSDQDILLDNVPSNGSFPQAELLHPGLNFASTSSSSINPHYLVNP